MRPIERGTHPVNRQGERVVYREYSEARGTLIERLGEYCSYCEMQLDAGLAVEHMIPKTQDRNSEKAWDNFLLACPNCNSTKGDQTIVLGDYVWPDRDNTFACLRYGPGALVHPAEGLDERTRTRTEKTIELVGLNRIPNDIADALQPDPDGRDKATDRRWRNRHVKWDIAKDRLRDLQEVVEKYGEGRAAELFRGSVIGTVTESGYWSIWMTVFADDLKTRQMLIDAFKATPSCFDPATTQPKPRMP